MERLNRRKTSSHRHHIYLYIYISRGSPGSRGGRWPTKTPPRGPCKRTGGAMVVHLGAYKSQLVATIVPYIYIYLGLVWLRMYGIQFPTDPMKDQFLSSVCVERLNRRKTSRRIFIYIDILILMQGVTGVPGGRWPMKTPRGARVNVPAWPGWQPIQLGP